jgi:hypothetical protein
MNKLGLEAASSNQRARLRTGRVLVFSLYFAWQNQPKQTVIP